MAAGWLVTAVLMWSGSSRAGQGTYEAFGLAAALSALLAIYCLTLPHTPPLAVAAGGVVGPPRGTRADPPADGGGVPRDRLRRRPDDTVRLPGDPSLPRVARAAAGLDLDRHDPGPVSRNRHPGGIALALPSPPVQRDAGPGDRCQRAALRQSHPRPAALGGDRGNPAPRSGHRLLQRGWAGLPRQPGPHAPTAPAPRPC